MGWTFVQIPPESARSREARRRRKRQVAHRFRIYLDYLLGIVYYFMKGEVGSTLITLLSKLPTVSAHGSKRGVWEAT